MATLDHPHPPVNAPSAFAPDLHAHRRDFVILDALAHALGDALAALPVSRDTERLQALALDLEDHAARQLAAFDALPAGIDPPAPAR